MDGLQILNRARATEVEGVLADPDIARVVALPLRDVGEFVFDHRALTQRLASSGCLDLLAEPRLKPLVLRNGDRASMADLGGGALRAHRTPIAHIGIEFDDRAERKGLHLSLGAFDRTGAEIEPEGRLRELAPVLRLPGFAHDLPAPPIARYDRWQSNGLKKNAQRSLVADLTPHPDCTYLPGLAAVGVRPTA